MYAKKHRPMQKLTAICLSVTIAAASLLSGHVFASDEAPQTDYLTGWELLAELREMGLGQDVIPDEEAPESDNSSETNTEDPSDTTGESGDGDQTDGTEPGNPDEGGSGEGDPDPGESTPEQPGDGDQTGGTEPGNPDGNNPGEGGSGEGDTDTDTDPGTDNPGEQPDDSDPAAGTDPDQGDGTEQGSDQNQPSAPAESTESAPDEPTSKDVPLVTQNDEITVNDPQIPGETPAAPEEDNDKDPAPSDEQTPSEDPGDDGTTTTPGDDNTSQNPDENPGGETTTPPEEETGDNQVPSGGDEIDPGFGVDPSTPIEEIPETSGITEEQRAELEAYVQTLEAEQVVSLDGTDITVQEYEDLCSMLTSEQLAAIELLLAGPNGEEIYSLIMAAQTLDEVNAILDSLDQAGLNALFGYMSEEQYAAMMDWIDVLEQAAIEAALSGGTVNFTNAAPLVGSTSAGAPSTVMRRSAARAALYAPPSEEGNDALELSKRVEKTAAGYQLVLEAYATGEVTSSTETKTVPTDIVLVLDQSGSMAENMDKVYYELLENRTDPSWFVNRSDVYVEINGQYFPVTATRTSVEGSERYNYTSVSGHDNVWYALNDSNLYYKVDDEKFVKLTVDYSWETYTYRGDGITLESQWSASTPDFDDRLYTLSVEYDYQYTFTYRDENGDFQTWGIVEEGEQVPEDWTFYQRRTEQITRLNALKEAANNFIDSVQESAAGADKQLGTDDDVRHRIAMVGFASAPGDNTNNTELLTGVTIWENNGAQYGTSTYRNALNGALLDVRTSDSALTNAVNALTANGATRTNYGLEMAEDILEAKPVQSGEDRNQVVIVFTDGVPGDYGFDKGGTSGWGGMYYFEIDVSGPTIQAASNIKDTATVYTIGIFEGADASNPNSLPPYTSGLVDSDSEEEIDNANRFMHLVSSNYPNATEMNAPGSVNDKLQGNGYYLSASDADALNEIFQTISDQIETPSTTVKLDGNAVLRDVITPYFDIDISDDRNVKAQIVPYAGNNAWDWEAAKNVNRDNIDIDTATNTVDVTGYDYSDEYIWDNKNTGTHGGSKLVVTIPIERDPYFIGGNGVPTNETTSGIYASDEAQEAFETFPVPSVNVPIDYGFAVSDKTIYLSQSQKIDFAAGGVFHDGGKAAKQLGGNAKANDYVDITYTVTDSEDKPVGTYTILAKGTASWDTTVPPELTPADCAELTITCTVTPIHDADSTQATQAVGTPAGPKLVNPSETAGGDGDKNADIHVLKPTLNFHDTQLTGPMDNYSLTGNQKEDFIIWSDFETGHTNRPDPTQTEPADASIVLNYTWMGNVGTIGADNTVDLEETANFKVETITIGRTTYTVGLSTDATADYHVTSDCSYDDLDPSLEDEHVNGRHFTIHLPSEFDLTITKTLAEGTTYTPGETFRFKVSGEDFYAEFTLGDTESYPVGGWSITITGLKRGNYTIEEDTEWSWRYDCTTDSTQRVTADKIENNQAEVTFTNTKTNNHWLSWEDTIQNIFKAS